MSITRTDVLRVRLETDDDGKVKASLLGAADAADKVKASTGGTASGAKVASEALGELKKASDEAEQSFLHNSRAITSFQDLLDDLASGQLGRAKREVAALANETGLLMKILSPVGLGITALTATIGVLVAGFITGEEQTAAFTRDIAATGNAIGATSGQLEGMVQQLGALNGGNYGGARQAIDALAQSGKVAATSFVDIGQAALDMSKLTGKSVDDSVKALIGLADSPAKAIEQYHLLTVAQYDQITALQKQGQQVTAEALLEHDAAQTLKQRAQDVQDSAGIIARAGAMIKSAWEGAWNAVDAIGRPSTDAEQLAALQAKASELQQQLVTGQQQAPRTGLNARAGALPTQDFDPAATGRQLQQVNAAIAELQTKMITAGFSNTQQQIDALATSQAVSAQQALDRYKSPDQKLQAAMDKARQDKANALWGNPTPEERTRIEAEFQQEVTAAHLAYTAALKKNDPGASKAATALAAFQSQTDSLTDKSLFAGDDSALSKYVQGVAKATDGFDKLIEKGVSASAATSAFDDRIKALNDTLDQSQKELHDKNAAALLAYTDAMDKSNAALKQQYDNQVAAVGMGAKEYQELQEVNKAYQDQADKLAEVAQKQLEFAATNGKSGLSAEDASAQTAVIKQETDKRVAIIQNGYAQMAAAQADWHNGAIRAMQDWADQGNDVAGQTDQMFTNAFGNMNDALVNFVQTGKLNFKSLIDNFIADLVRMELRVIESKILMSILGAGVGGSGLDTYGDGQFNSLTGYGTYTGAGSTSLGGYATGGAFDISGAITAFANGGAFANSIVNKPTLFAFANGTGVMGEAGPEAIMPLTRGPDGKLGVQSNGGGASALAVEVNITNQSGQAVQGKQTGQRRDGQKVIIDMVLQAVAGDMASGGVTAQAAQQRFGLQRRGVPVGG